MTDTRKSKKMVATEKEIEAARVQISNFVSRQKELMNFEPDTQGGKEAKKQAQDKLASDRKEAEAHYNELRFRLEVETVEFLSGADTDLESLFDGEGGGSALRQGA